VGAVAKTRRSGSSPITSSGPTIAAIASPRGPGKRGVIRVSGPLAWRVVEEVWCGQNPLPDPAQRGLHQGRFQDATGTQPLFLLWMPGPRSFTRENVAEFHLPGSAPLLEAALTRILALGIKAAGPGEFTRRAFENGRIDLTRAEGILALVHARNQAERRSASALLFGGLAERLLPLRDGIAALRALAEASLDFDEADTGHVPGEELVEEARRLLRELADASNWEARRVAHSDLPQVVLVGAPNAGKSSLFNALVTDSAAIVSSAEGTTRDVLQGTWQLPGGQVRLFDTAGIDDEAKGPDATAQRLGREVRKNADLQLFLVAVDEEGGAGVSRAASMLVPDVPAVLVHSKADKEAPREFMDGGLFASQGSISSLAGQGLEELAGLVSKLLWPVEGAQPTQRLEREIGVRHRVALTRSAETLEGGLGAWLAGLPLDLFAEALRESCAELDAISGKTTAEDLLDRIFSSFCIGK
jgi:tRNA modification GTPase